MTTQTSLAMALITNTPGHEAWGITCPVCRIGTIIHYPGDSMDDIEAANCRLCGTMFKVLDHAIVGVV